MHPFSADPFNLQSIFVCSWPHFILMGICEEDMVMAVFHLPMTQKEELEWNAWSHSHPEGLHSWSTACKWEFPTVLGSFSWAQSSSTMSVGQLLRYLVSLHWYMLVSWTCGPFGRSLGVGVHPFLFTWPGDLVENNSTRVSLARLLEALIELCAQLR